MNATKAVKLTALLVLLAWMPAAAVKYIAIVETDVDAASGASADINPAEVREITAELRRGAVNNLPRDKYSVMTSETVQSMGGAVLEECSEENCVVTLGSRIGADYIVRGTISKFQTKLTLSIEMYETENGTLVASSDPVRSEKPAELLEMAAGACADMYKKFAGVKGTAKKSKAKAEPEAVAKSSESVMPKKRKHDYYIAPKYQFPVGTPVSWGGINVEGGLVWGNGMFLGIDLNLGVNFEDENEALAGIGISLGNVYDLFGGQLQLVYGGSAGFWFAADVQYQGGADAYFEAWNFLAPFVKLRWSFVELTYRGLLGIGCTGSRNEDRHGYYADDFDGFGWNNHQLMLGLYFATSKRDR